MNDSSPWSQLSDPESEGRGWLRWIVRLRWVAIVAQMVTLSFALPLLDAQSSVIVIIGVIALLIAGNLAALRTLSREQPVAEWTLLAHLTLEVLGLTASIMFAGGPFNPFVPLYLVHVAMGAVMMSWSTASVLLGIVLACHTSLHLWHLPLHLERHTLSEQTLSVAGSALAFTITAVSVAVFVVGLSREGSRRKQALLAHRDYVAQTDRLRAVGTLAAGAAHELNTPLSTIGLRLRRIARRHSDDSTVGDLSAMRGQLERCKRIVEQLLAGAGDPSAAGIEVAPIADFVEQAVSWWEKGASVDVTVSNTTDDLVIEVPRVAFTQALINLLENAREAQDEAGTTHPLEVDIHRQGTMGMIIVRDHGCGLPAEPDRIGDPFFTTKATGTGLGVFVARAVAQGAGGGLSYYAGKDGTGESFTEVRWWFPEAESPRRPA